MSGGFSSKEVLSFAVFICFAVSLVLIQTFLVPNKNLGLLAPQKKNASRRAVYFLNIHRLHRVTRGNNHTLLPIKYTCIQIPSIINIVCTYMVTQSFI